MFYEKELRFVCDVFHKSHVRALILPLEEIADRMDEYSAEGLLDPRFRKGGNIYRILQSPEPRTVYRLTDAFYRCFLCLLLPSTEKPSLLFIGPFLSSAISQQQRLMLGEEMNISPQKQKYLHEYYQSLAIIPSDGHLILMFTTFCERLWMNPSFSIVEVDREDLHSNQPEHSPVLSPVQSDVLMNVKALERRYAFENQLLHSVSLGQLHMEDQLVMAFSPEFFEKRASDPLRNAKNYGIIMNTLLRKAAEDGGVHPVYLDRTSSEFAHRIEKLASLADNTALMSEMFRTYCRLVRRHALQKYSPVVRRTIVTIDSDLTADLSPRALAEAQALSLGYLSTIFHKETGKTLSDFVRQRRMEYAAYLLSGTDLQIQTVALHCGIMDVQYFSKLFKGHHGMTPTAYRQIHKQTLAL